MTISRKNLAIQEVFYRITLYYIQDEAINCKAFSCTFQQESSPEKMITTKFIHGWFPTEACRAITAKGNKVCT
jgi:hypothetical protein